MEQSDISQLGISESNHEFLAKLKTLGIFDEMADGYRFAIGMAIARGEASETIVKRENMYSRATIDGSGVFVEAIRLLYPSVAQPYRYVELLADWGLTEMRRLHSAGNLDLSEIIRLAEIA